MEKNKYVIFDTNIWVAFYKDNDSLKNKAIAEIEKFTHSKKQCLITNLIAEEVFSVLTYAGYKKLANQFIDFCLKNKRVKWLNLDDNFIKNINKFTQIKSLLKTKLSFTDYSIIFLSNNFGFEILSFDKELVKIYKKIN